MSKHTLQLLLASCVVTGTLWAANDPFAGKWKLNPSKSKLTDEMKVAAAGPNRYALTFGPGGTETIVADGTDQPGLDGSTFSITVEGPRTWRGVRKRNGRILLTGIWNLSKDGNTLDDDFTGYRADGSKLHLHYVYQRTEGGPGFLGTWDSISEEVNSAVELQIQPYDDNGLSFINQAQQARQNMKFDGKDYPSLGPNAVSGSVSSGRRVNERTLELTDKMKGKVMDTRELKLSPGADTLTMTVYPIGRNKPNILVFDRE